jgi:hypothetical protein
MGRRADASGAPREKTGTTGASAAGGKGSLGNEAAQAEEPASASVMPGEHDRSAVEGRTPFEGDALAAAAPGDLRPRARPALHSEPAPSLAAPGRRGPLALLTTTPSGAMAVAKMIPNLGELGDPVGGGGLGLRAGGARPGRRRRVQRRRGRQFAYVFATQEQPVAATEDLSAQVERTGGPNGFGDPRPKLTNRPLSARCVVKFGGDR